MKKTFVLEDLGCASCAAKMERNIRKLDGVREANISFMTSRLTLDAEDSVFNEVVEKAKAICRKIEPDCRLVL
jgi:copper chaperone CopZ